MKDRVQDLQVRIADLTAALTYASPEHVKSIQKELEANRIELEVLASVGAENGLVIRKPWRAPRTALLLRLTLLTLVTFTGILSCFVIYNNRPTKESSAIKRLRLSHGYRNDSYGPDGHVISLTLECDSNDDFITVSNLYALETLDLTRSRISDFSGLRALKGLATLKLSATQIQDADLAYIQDMKQLRRLYIDNTGISDQGVLALTNLHLLEELYAVKSAVTNAKSLLPNCTTILY